jgi:fatty-acyl-CoA synthase
MWKGAQRPFAFVTLDAGAALDEVTIRAACAANLSHYKVPAGIEIVPAFPVTEGPNGVKIQKHVLRRRAAELLAGEPR